MKWIAIILAPFLVLSCGINQPAANQPPANAQDGLEGTSYLKTYTDANGRSIREIRNHTISPHTAMLTDIPNDLILESIITKREFTDHDSCATGHLRLNFYKTMEDTLVLYRAYSTAADHYGFISNSRDIFKTVIDPCGRFDRNGRLYSLYSPDPILTYNNYYSEITLPRTDIVRYAGFQPDQTYWDFNAKLDKKKLIGILHYGSNRKNLAKVAIYVDDNQSFRLAREHPPQLFVLAERSDNVIRRKDMEVYPDKGEDFYTVPTNFSLEINFTKEDDLPTIVIPVENDELKLDQVKEGPYKLEKLD